MGANTSQRHRLSEGQANDFDVRNLSELANNRQESTLTRSLLLASIAAVSAVGVGFGLYPARKASQLDPIDALRYE